MGPDAKSIAGTIKDLPLELDLSFTDTIPAYILWWPSPKSPWSAHKPSMPQFTMSLYTKDPVHSRLHESLPHPWTDSLEIIPICLDKFFSFFF